MLRSGCHRFSVTKNTTVGRILGWGIRLQRMHRTRRDQIFRALRQPAPIFGALLILVFWISLNYQLSVDRKRATEAAIQNGDRLTRLISDHIAQLVGTIDRTLLL